MLRHSSASQAGGDVLLRGDKSSCTVGAAFARAAQPQSLPLHLQPDVRRALVAYFALMRRPCAHTRDYSY